MLYCLLPQPLPSQHITVADFHVFSLTSHPVGMVQVPVKDDVPQTSQQVQPLRQVEVSNLENQGLRVPLVVQHLLLTVQSMLRLGGTSNYDAITYTQTNTHTRTHAGTHARTHTHTHTHTHTQRACIINQSNYYSTEKTQ